LHHLVKAEQISTTDVLMVAIHLPAMTSLLWTSRSGIRCSSGDGTSQELLDIFLGWIAELWHIPQCVSLFLMLGHIIQNISSLSSVMFHSVYCCLKLKMTLVYIQQNVI
jgi:hypothetical protein